MVSAMLMLSSAVGMMTTDKDVNVVPAIYNADCLRVLQARCIGAYMHSIAAKYHHFSLADGSLAHLLINSRLLCASPC